MMAAMNQPSLRGELKCNEPMQKHTSWRIGGVAEKFFTPEDLEDLVLYMQSLTKDENIFFLGLGSNLLVRDGGIKGSVISLKGHLAEIESLTDNKLLVGAGCSCAKLARYCSRNNLIGGEFFAGIPGLLGGALAMNAGAFGGETWAQVESVTTINHQGVLQQRKAKEFDIGYRSVKGVDKEFFVSAILKFTEGDGELAAKQVRDLLDKRAATQPTGLPSCGSVFTNPENDFAARLIESCGLKGFKIGGAVVSEKHANFIINENNASAADVEALIKHIQQTVKQQHNIELHTEVKIIGEVVHD